MLDFFDDVLVKMFVKHIVKQPQVSLILFENCKGSVQTFDCDFQIILSDVVKRLHFYDDFSNRYLDFTSGIDHRLRD